MKYTLKTPANVQMASGKKLKNATPTIWYNHDDEINGSEYYVVLGKTMKHVVKVGNNRYIPFEAIVSAEAKSGLILPPTFFVGQMQQEGYSYGAGNKSVSQNQAGMLNRMDKALGQTQSVSQNQAGLLNRRAGFDGTLPPNNIAVEDWISNNEISYSSVVGETSVVELTPAQVAEQYKASGSNQAFNDWVKGQGKNLLIDFGTQLADTLMGKGNTGNTGAVKTGGTKGGTPAPKPETTILGMHPVTFAFAALGTIAVVGFLTLGVKWKKAVKTPAVA